MSAFSDIMTFLGSILEVVYALGEWSGREGGEAVISGRERGPLVYSPGS